jgi:hypothetical protein
MKAKHKVYFNLHKKCLSVQYKGKVIDHAKSICLKDVEFKVSQAGRSRVLREKRKNVHAFVVGDISLNRPPMYYLNKYSEKYTEFERKVTYNPYKYNSFVYADTEEPIKNADYVFIEGKSIFALN